MLVFGGITDVASKALSVNYGRTSEEVPILIPGACECVLLQGKGEVRQPVTSGLPIS